MKSDDVEMAGGDTGGDAGVDAADTLGVVDGCTVTQFSRSMGSQSENWWIQQSQKRSVQNVNMREMT